LARRAEGDQPVQIAGHVEAHVEVDAARDRFEPADRGEPHVQGVAGTQQYRLIRAERACLDRSRVRWGDGQAENFGIKICQHCGLLAVDDNGVQMWHQFLLAPPAWLRARIAWPAVYRWKVFVQASDGVCAVWHSGTMLM
jgi:hypothetical protein